MRWEMCTKYIRTVSNGGYVTLVVNTLVMLMTDVAPHLFVAGKWGCDPEDEGGKCSE